MTKTQKSYRETKQKLRPATTPEGQESRMIALAINLAEQQLRDGTASSQVITHYLKLGSTKEQREREKLEEEIQLLKAKTSAIQSQQRIEELYEEAMEVMKVYNGQN